MDAKVLYWTGALINMGVLTFFAVSGVRQIRRGEVARHRRSMVIAIALVVGFIASYALKLVFLGREDLASWSPLSVNMLRFHETCVGVMVVAGALALHRGLRLARTRVVTREKTDPAPSPADVRRHRLVGRWAVAGAVLGLLSAGAVLAAMYGRL